MADDFGMGYALGADSGNRNNNDMFGCGGSWWIVIILFALIFGNNWGNNGNNGAGMAVPYLSGIDTRQAVNDGFVTAEIQSGIRGLQNGLCDGFYAMNTGMLNGQIAMQQGFNATQMGMMQGFDGTNQRLADLGYQVQSCCCQTNRNLDSVKYENAKNTCDIINAVNASAQRVIDQMTTDKIDDLRTELQSAQLQLSNNSQTANLIATLRPFPQPAYITCSPYTSSNAGCCYGGVA